jgi:hypothetical protein
MKSVFAAVALSLVASSALAADVPSPPAFTPGGGTVCRGSDGFASDFGGRRTFGWRPEALTWVKANLADPAIAPAYRALIADADKALAGATYTVVDKARTPPSGDKHDYMSIGPYWWPDASKPDGLPYVRRDGKVNPERDTNAFDTADLEAMSASVEALALAYYFTEDRRYAAKASELLRVWFLDPATRMNPNVSFAQAVPGRSAGRAEGVLDTFRLLRVVEGIGLLGPSGAIKPEQQEGLEAWFGDYVKWMATAPTGKEERAAPNNHGLWYDYQIVQFSLFARLDDVAKVIVSKAPTRLASQIETDGRMPLELARTRSYHYTAFALQAAAGTADLGRCVGLDLWRATAPDGGDFRKALEFILAYVGREETWPHPEMKKDAIELYEISTRAAFAYGDAGFGAKAATLAPRYPTARLKLKLRPYQP